MDERLLREAVRALLSENAGAASGAELELCVEILTSVQAGVWPEDELAVLEDLWEERGAFDPEELDRARQDRVGRRGGFRPGEKDPGAVVWRVWARVFGTRLVAGTQPITERFRALASVEGLPKKVKLYFNLGHPSAMLMTFWYLKGAEGYGDFDFTPEEVEAIARGRRVVVPYKEAMARFDASERRGAP